MTSEQKVKKFLEYLEGQLENKNITAPQFARMIGVPKSTVYSWLNGVSVMSLEKYYRALEALEIEEQLFIQK